MGQATRTTTLLLDLAPHKQGGANPGKRQALEETVRLLEQARTFYVDFFLAHPAKATERVEVLSARTGEVEERLLSAEKLLTWAEAQTVETANHPEPLANWNCSQRFPELPYQYRRSVIKDAIGKVRGYLSTLVAWQQSGAKKGKPGLPGASNYPVLYQGTFRLDLEEGQPLADRFVRLKVYAKGAWIWAHYPVKLSRYFASRLADPAWETQSPTPVVQPRHVALHFPQTKAVTAKKVVEIKRDPDLVTVAVDLNVKMLAVITVRQHGQIQKTIFVRDRGLDQHRYRHLKRVARKQWQSGKPVAGEHSNQQLWEHLRRQNRDVSHKTARAIARVCAEYPACLLVMDRLRVIRPKGGASPDPSTASRPINCAARSPGWPARRRTPRER